MNYSSFLVCFHEKHTDLYQNGLPLGVVRDGEFYVHNNIMPDGTRVPIDLPSELAKKVIGAVKLMNDHAIMQAGLHPKT